MTICSIVLGCTLVLPPMSSLSDLYFGKMCEVRCTKCRLKFLTQNKRSPLVGRALAIFLIVSGCTLVLPPTSSLPDLYIGKIRVFATRWKSIGHLFDEGILVCIFFGQTPEVLKLSSFHSLEVHFNLLLTPNDHSPLVGKALAIFSIWFDTGRAFVTCGRTLTIFSIVSGCTLVHRPISWLPNLYFGKTELMPPAHCFMFYHILPSSHRRFYSPTICLAIDSVPNPSNHLMVGHPQIYLKFEVGESSAHFNTNVSTSSSSSIAHQQLQRRQQQIAAIEATLERLIPSLMEVFSEICLEADQTNGMNISTISIINSAAFHARSSTSGSEMNNGKPVPL
ncbi:uncharacterized protein E5676_scaffold778G00420 [Cucumis melo var. makuwa]|uniref:Uncharacterized protein n=1 Tax=Cucumis melo var. makuwa TaxID=1194695 RepID=A0A5D3DC18_CUCMM|nr:uncharacterized protein E5676_scaffold778G00420 [Cucumis melo var. makuwa]